jgi:hypothetical protein
MSKKNLLPKRIRKTIRKNPYATGITTALVALGGLAAVGLSNGDLRQRSRDLKDGLMRRLSNKARPPLEQSVLSAANQPY